MNNEKGFADEEDNPNKRKHQDEASHASEEVVNITKEGIKEDSLKMYVKFMEHMNGLIIMTTLMTRTIDQIDKEIFEEETTITILTET